MAPRRTSSSVKIADVARIAGVSVATVSRALANPDIVTDEARAKVIAAVRETGYTPNAAARNLRARRAMMVLVVLPDIANPFFSEVLRGVDAALSERGYGLIIGSLDNSRKKEGRFIALAQSGQVDGILLLCGHVLSDGVRSLADSRLPIVAACEHIPGTAIPCVEVDNREAAEQAVHHLTGLGHKRIAYLSGPASNVLDHARRKGYLDALAAAQIPRSPALEFEGNFTFQAGTDAADRILSMPKNIRPTALFSANDEMAIACLKRLLGAGVRVPEDFSIVGFDAIDYADYASPTLTTVRQPRRDLGYRAGQLLAQVIEGEQPPQAPVILDAPLLVRGSTGPA